jgi:hypothetical protein
MIKVILKFKEGAAESLWATPISDTIVKIENIPFLSQEFSLGDLVEINEDQEIIRIVEKGAFTYAGFWECEGDINEAWTQLRDHFKKYDIKVEGGSGPSERGPGFFSMAVPRDINTEALKTICLSSPIQIVDTHPPLEGWEEE